jgi:hypothetical protein
MANASAVIHPSSPLAVSNVNPPVKDAASSMSVLSSPRDQNRGPNGYLGECRRVSGAGRSGGGRR